MKKTLLVGITLLFSLWAGSAFAGGQATSGKAASDIITEVRSYLNESTASFWTDAELLKYIDAGLKDLVARTHCTQDLAKIQLSGNSREYTWSGASGYVAIEDRVFFFNSGTSKYHKMIRDETIAGRTSETGQPEYWHESNGKIYFWPTPSSTYSGHTVYMDYVPIHTAISATTSKIIIPTSYDQCLVWYVVSQAFAKLAKFDQAEYFMRRYEVTADRYRADFITKPPEQRTQGK
jgi:hypothetical protein